MALLTLKHIVKQGVADSELLLHNLDDYATAVFSLTWQRQMILLAIAVLTGSFFEPLYAAVFFTVGMFCELVDLSLARVVRRLDPSKVRQIRRVFAGFMVNTVISASGISFYAVWVAVMEGGKGVFTALFCLFAAALYAALNNHQLAWALAIRLVMYGTSFILITASDLWLYRPPLSSEIWLQFFTVVFVMYFLIDTSIGFLRLYRKNLKNLKDLEVEHEKTKAALVVKSQFVSVVSHELRTPLTSIKGSLDLINSGRIGGVDPQVQTLLDMAGKNSRRLEQLVNDLLDLQKIEAGEMRFERGRVDLRRLVEDAIASHYGLAEKFGVKLKAGPKPPRPVYVIGDESRLMQVMSNMISNAAKFSPEGGTVTIGCEAKDETARLYVADKGSGIPEGAQERVFGRFTQLDSSDQRKIGGTGLGLNISREIVEALDGHIDYESTLGEGSTFFVDLPRVEVTSPNPAVIDDPDVIPLRKAANS